MHVVKRGALQLRDAVRDSTPTGIQARLPSSDAAKAFLEGAPGGTIKLVTSTALRSALIMPGLLIAGIEPKKALVGSLVASSFISAFILIYMSASKSPSNPLMQARSLRGGLPPRRY